MVQLSVGVCHLTAKLLSHLVYCAFLFIIYTNCRNQMGYQKPNTIFSWTITECQTVTMSQITLTIRYEKVHKLLTHEYMTNDQLLLSGILPFSHAIFFCNIIILAMLNPLSLIIYIGLANFNETVEFQKRLTVSLKLVLAKPNFVFAPRQGYLHVGIQAMRF